MQALASAVAIIVSISSGAILGVLLGFLLAEYKSVIAGVRLPDGSGVARRLALSIHAFGLRHRVLYSALALVCLVTFFALCAVPVITAAEVLAPQFLKAATILFLGVAYVSRALGAGLWRRWMGRAA